jgi:ligand-binding sensor domain-containing protein
VVFFWISTQKGLFISKENPLLIRTEVLFEDKGTGNYIEDSKGNIWFNCSRSIYSLKWGETYRISNTEGNYGPLTFQIYQD